MKKLRFRLLFIVLLTIFSIYFIVPRNNLWYQMPFTGKDYKLWLDLQWWVELDYKIDLEQVRQEEWYNQEREKSIVEWLKSIVDKRVEALKISDSQISTATYWNEKHIIVQIPLKGWNKSENELNIKRAKEAIWKVMKIEFKELRTEITADDLAQRKEIALNLYKESKESKYDFVVTKTKYKDTYENIQIWTMTWSVKDLSKFFDVKKLKEGYQDDILTWTWFSTFNWDWKEVDTKWYWIVKNLWEKEWVYNIDYAFVLDTPSEWKPAKDSAGRVLSDKYFIKSSVQTNSQSFQPMIELTFNDEWAKIFWELTKRLKGQPIAIFVWWENLTAPRVNDVILSWKAVITWDYTFEEARQLSNDINTWVVPAPIYLTSEKSIDSKLWLNSLHELLIAWLYWFLLIFIFLVVFYRVAWFSSAIALIIYSVVTILVIKSFWVVLTLASVAWLILSVWMAIDANILIFERIKDELKANVKLDIAVKNWFDKSWTAIWDSNLTWIIISIILYIFWVNMIKWFWLTLWIWLVTSLFSAMFVSRLFILVIIKKTKISTKNFIWYKE